MILADTSIWIEFLKGGDEVIRSMMVKELSRRNIIAASPVFGELLQGVEGERERSIIETYWLNLPKQNEFEIFIEAGRLSSNNKIFSRGLGLIDCAILALALKGSHQLWTLDKKLERVAKEVF